jgi:ferredoxin
MGMVSMASPVRIRRVESLCIDCGKCAKACPSALPVDRLITIQSAECLSGPCRRRVPAWAIAAGVAVLFVSVTSYARWTGRWRTDLPAPVYFELIPQARALAR